MSFDFLMTEKRILDDAVKLLRRGLPMAQPREPWRIVSSEQGGDISIKLYHGEIETLVIETEYSSDYGSVRVAPHLEHLEEKLMGFFTGILDRLDAEDAEAKREADRAAAEAEAARLAAEAEAVTADIDILNF